MWDVVTAWQVQDAVTFSRSAMTWLELQAGAACAAVCPVSALATAQLPVPGELTCSGAAKGRGTAGIVCISQRRTVVELKSGGKKAEIPSGRPLLEAKPGILFIHE